MSTGKKIAVIGTGIVGQTVAAKLAELGHAVFVGTRDPAATLARTDPDPFGNPPFKEWRAQHPEIELGTLAQAAGHGELIVNATQGAHSLAALEAAGEANLAGKVLLDIANPLDFSHGMPPSLTLCNTDSLGEQIQRRFPNVKVVKALNTVAAFVMVDPGQVAGADHTVFVSGDDADAKGEVTELLQTFGWKDVLDLGDISTARGTEMLLPLWVRVMMATNNPLFGFKIARNS